MNIMIRTDASIYIGSGHVMRCLTLAEELRISGDHEIYFVCRPQNGDLIDVILQRQFKVKILPSVKRVIPEKDTDYQAWLQVPPLDDVRDVLNMVKKCDIAIVDHYGITQEWETEIKRRMECTIIAIDDLTRPHHANIILDSTLGRNFKEYDTNSIVVSGIDYALLAAPFKYFHQLSSKRTQRNRVLVTMGGIDAPNATLAILKVLSCRSDLKTTVLLSPKAPHYQSVKNYSQRHSHITHLDFVEDMAALMFRHDFSIGAPGTTSWERACLGLPGILIPIADNQKTICQNLVNIGAAVELNLPDISVCLDKKIVEILENYEKFKNNNLKICDGLGTKRVTWIIERNHFTSAPLISLHLATEDDIDLVFHWQQHHNTRRYALNKNIPSYDEHVKWMRNKIFSLSDKFYIIEDIKTHKKTGVVRLDFQQDVDYLISIFIAPDYYRHGIAHEALLFVSYLHPEWNIHAVVLKENKASQKLFQKAHYEKISEENFLKRASK